MTYYGDSRPDDQDTDIAMTSLFHQLDSQDLPDDPPFDLEAGLLNLTSRIHAEIADEEDDEAPSRDDHDQLLERIDWLERDLAAGRIRESAIRDVAHKQNHEIDRLERRWAENEIKAAMLSAEKSHELSMLKARSRNGLYYFIGIVALAVGAIGLTAVQRWSPLADAVVGTVVTAVAAAAGTLIHRVSVLADRTTTIRRSQRRDPAWDPGPQPLIPGTASPTTIHIDKFSGRLGLASPPTTGPPRTPSFQLHPRAITAAFAVLALAAVTAVIVGVVGIVGQGRPLTGYEITLIETSTISVLLLLTTWSWRAADRPSVDQGAVPASHDATIGTDNRARLTDQGSSTTNVK